MKTLAIETGIEPEYENALIASAEKNNWDVKVVQHIPFSNIFSLDGDDLGLPIDDELKNNPDVWLHGSIQACKSAQAGTAWQVHAPWQELKCSSYYKKLSKHILQKEHIFSTMGDMAADKEKIFSSELVEDGTIFVRPDGCDKSFNGGCISLDTWDHQYKLITFYDPPNYERVVLARPQNIIAEARFLVVGGKLITGSYYKTGGQSVRLRAESSLTSVAEEMLAYCIDNNFDPAPSWVLDLAQTTSGWSIIEVGSSSCCGLYKCDTDLFIQALDELIFK